MEFSSVEAIGAVPPEFAPLVQDPSELRAGEADHLALLSCAERLELHLDVYPDAGSGAGWEVTFIIPQENGHFGGQRVSPFSDTSIWGFP